MSAYGQARADHGEHLERLAVLEERIKNVDSKVVEIGGRLEKKVAEISVKTDSMYELLLQAKGAQLSAKWLVMGIAGVSGALAGWSHKIIPFLNK